MSEFEQTALDLPGMPATPTERDSTLVQAVHTTIAELAKGGHVGPVDVGRVALSMELAEVIAAKRRSGRMSTIGNDARVLMELLDGFRADIDDDDRVLREAQERWDRVMARLGSSLPEVPEGEGVQLVDDDDDDQGESS